MSEVGFFSLLYPFLQFFFEAISEIFGIEMDMPQTKKIPIEKMTGTELQKIRLNLKLNVEEYAKQMGVTASQGFCMKIISLQKEL